jgi:thiamine biosynthesis lipoprotein
MSMEAATAPAGVQFQAMGSPCELKLHAPAALAADVAARARAEVERLEQRYSRYRPDSLLGEINAVAGRGGGIDVDDETAQLLDYAATCHAESGGLFDITSGVLRRAWRFREGRLPARAEVDALLVHVGWQKLRWQRPRLELPAGMELDFGGIVKEYAADRVATLCVEAGCESALVNLGGDIRATGPQPGGSPWHVGIRDPRARNQDAPPLHVLALERGAVATSGDYERCIVVDGRRYGHVLDPRSGWPVQHLASVTVLADFCVLAGSAATIALLREADGPRWLAGLGLPHLWIDVRGEVGGSLAGP